MFIFILFIGVLHSLLPNHWLPLSLWAKESKLSKIKAIGYFFVIAFTHNLSTVILSIITLFLGVSLAEHIDIFENLSVFVLMGIGLFYLLTKEKRLYSHEHNHAPEELSGEKRVHKVFYFLLVSMFFSPCIDVIIAFFYSGSQLGVTISLFYIFFYGIISTLIATSITFLSYITLIKIHFHFLEKHMRKLVGILFITLGLSGYYFDDVLHSYIHSINVGHQHNLSDESIEHDDH